MDKPNILLGRIDNRLVHGQVGGTWVRYLAANLVLVADDAVSEDSLQQSLMKMVAESVGGVQMRFFSLAKTIEIIGNASPNQKIFIVTRTPKDMRILLEGNVPIPEVNVGNLHSGDGKKNSPKTPHMWVNAADEKDLAAIKTKVKRMFYQVTPFTDSVDL